jgi:hypothetical protein
LSAESLDVPLPHAVSAVMAKTGNAMFRNVFMKVYVKIV